MASTRCARKCIERLTRSRKAEQKEYEEEANKDHLIVDDANIRRLQFKGRKLVLGFSQSLDTMHDRDDRITK